MKLAIVFEVPDGTEEAYQDIAEQLIAAHRKAMRDEIEYARGAHYWTFDMAMRPVAAALAETDREVVRAIDQALGVGVTLRTCPAECHDRCGDRCCRRCGAINITWFADSVVWNRVVGDEGGVLCVTCFAEAAESIGISVWKLTPEV